MLGTEAGNDIGHELELASGHVLIAQRKDLQQGQCFLGLFARGDILQDRLRLTVLGDDHRFPLLCEAGQNLGSIGLEVADRLDLR